MDVIEKEISKVIVFQLEDEEYVLPVENVGGIERLQPITRVPQTKEYIKGVINLRGVVTPVIDLRVRFGMNPKSYDKNTRIIIVYLEDVEVGFLVDTANDVLDLSNQILEPTPDIIGSIKHDYIQGVVHVNHRLLSVLDLGKILNDEANSSQSSVERSERN